MVEKESCGEESCGQCAEVMQEMFWSGAKIGAGVGAMIVIVLILFLVSAVTYL